jgi:ADP-heptose:LPS heptosyltransferase
VIAEAKNHQKKKKTIVIQPYGSTALMCPLEIFDDSLRSIPQKMYLTLVNKLSKDYNIIYMGAKEFHDNISYKPEPDPSLRDWAGVIKSADYFIGCDSCGQHFAKAVGQNASIMIAGTHKINVTYPDTFHIIERDCEFYPDAMRISQIQGQLSSRLNEERIMFTDEEIEDAYQTILKNIGQEKSNQLVEVKSNKSLSYE